MATRRNIAVDNDQSANGSKSYEKSVHSAELTKNIDGYRSIETELDPSCLPYDNSSPLSKTRVIGNRRLQKTKHKKDKEKAFLYENMSGILFSVGLSFLIAVILTLAAYKTIPIILENVVSLFSAGIEYASNSQSPNGNTGSDKSRTLKIENKISRSKLAKKLDYETFESSYMNRYPTKFPSSNDGNDFDNFMKILTEQCANETIYFDMLGSSRKSDVSATISFGELSEFRNCAVSERSNPKKSKPPKQRILGAFRHDDIFQSCPALSSMYKLPLLPIDQEGEYFSHIFSTSIRKQSPLQLMVTSGTTTTNMQTFFNSRASGSSAKKTPAIHSLKGVAFHQHRSGWNELIEGSKTWYFIDPKVVRDIGFNPNGDVHEWLGVFENSPIKYDSLKNNGILEIVQNEGEVVYVPEGYIHSSTCTSSICISIHQHVPEYFVNRTQAARPSQYCYNETNIVNNEADYENLDDYNSDGPYFYLKLAENHIDNRNYSLAVKVVKTSIAIHKPYYPASLVALARAYELMKDLDEAVVAYDNAILANPRNPILYGDLIRLMIRWNEKLEDDDRKIRLNNDKIAALLQRASDKGIKDDVVALIGNELM